MMITKYEVVSSCNLSNIYYNIKKHQLLDSYI
jgi:hypothetical protein